MSEKLNGDDRINQDNGDLKSLPDWIDRSLWFTLKFKSHRCYLERRNPHTFPGRIAAYDPRENVSFNVNVWEIGESSAETRIWLAGYLAGNEPDPPDGEVVDPITGDHPSYQRWLRGIETYRREGNWPREAPNAAHPEGWDEDEQSSPAT
jgi:hypothetical protein